MAGSTDLHRVNNIQKNIGHGCLNPKKDEKRDRECRVQQCRFDENCGDASINTSPVCAENVLYVVPMNEYASGKEECEEYVCRCRDRVIGQYEVLCDERG